LERALEEMKKEQTAMAEAKMKDLSLAKLRNRQAATDFSDEFVG
jgi:hypothetical protein